MKYRRLGKTNLRVSVIGIGTAQFGGEWGKNFSPDEVAALLDRAADLGVNLIDTAACYGDHLSEELIGRAIQGRRDRWIVATKFGHKFKGRLNREPRFEPDQVRRQLDESLRALRTDYIDVYQFHSGGDDRFQSQGLWEMLQEQKSAGTIRHLGISLGGKDNPCQVERAPSVAADTIQVVYNRISRQAEQAVLPACRRLDLGVLARVPLASGFLTGKYNPGATFSEDELRGKVFGQEKIDELAAEAQRLRSEEVPEGVSMPQWALAWCLQHPAVSCGIPGCKTVAQVESNAAAAELDLVRDDHPQSME